MLETLIKVLLYCYLLNDVASSRFFAENASFRLLSILVNFLRYICERHRVTQKPLEASSLVIKLLVARRDVTDSVLNA